MSNGIGPNPLNPLSKIYLDCIAEKKDDTYLEPDMKKRQANNEKARKELAKGCLLYTSPSPRDLSTSRMPSSA